MTARTLGIALALAVAGAVGGYAVGAAGTAEPRGIPTAVPVPAASPSYPVTEYDVQPDPAVAPLRPGLRLERSRLRYGVHRLDAAVPRGWVRGGEPGSWIYSAPDNPRHTYYLRVGVLAAGKRSVGVEKNTRIAALRDAEANDAMDRVVVEEDRDDGFVATYLQGGYRRVSMERFVDLDTPTAYATVAVIGREADREGMADLLERVVASLEVP